MLIATASFAVMNLIAKNLSDLHAMQIVFYRCLGTFVFIFPYMLYMRVSIIGNNPKFLVIRAVIGIISLATFFFAIQRMPLGSAISIRYLGPIFGACFAYYFLKEKISGKQWFCFGIAFLGVIVLKGVDIRIDNLGLLLAFISALFVGMVFVLIRYLGDKEHYLTIINYFMVISILVSLFFIPYWVVPPTEKYFSIFSIGIFGLIGQVFMTKAFQKEETNVLAPFKYMELVYALFLTYFIFGETYSAYAMIGMSLIILGMLLNLYVKNTQN